MEKRTEILTLILILSLVSVIFIGSIVSGQQTRSGMVYSKCSNGMCQQFACTKSVPCISTCTSNADCSHSECVGSTCTLIPTPGLSSCTNNNQCTSQPVCGNGIAEPPEECDTNDFLGATCQTFGFNNGNLGCTSTCTYDTSQCYTQICGNGIIEQGEECDGTNLGSATCQSLGHLGGTLSCASSCIYDTTQCYDYRYAVIDLNTLPGTGNYLQVNAISKLGGKMTGTFHAPNEINNQAFYLDFGGGNPLFVIHPEWSNGQSTGKDVNNAGDVVFKNTLFGGTSYKWNNDYQTTQLDGADTEVDGINNAGNKIVGTKINIPSSNPVKGFLWENGVFTILNPEVKSAPAVNNAGQIACTTFSGKACKWENGQITSLGTLGGSVSSTNSLDINEMGNIVGLAVFPTGYFHGFIYKNGVMSDLGTLNGGLNSEAFAINDLNHVVGVSNVGGIPYSVPFIWKNGIMIDINTLIPPDSLPVLSIGIVDIDNEDNIVVSGWYNGGFHSYLLCKHGSSLCA